jgi:hypothetical protein
MFLNCGASLPVVIHIIALKLHSVTIDLFLELLFIFIQEKACSQMYVDPNSLEILLLPKIHKTKAEELT